MDAFFLQHAFRMRPIPAGGKQLGFVYTNLSEGNKVVLVRLLGPEGPQDFEFSLPVRGLETDHLRREFQALHPPGEMTDVDMDGLSRYLASAPPTTTNGSGRRSGDPANLAVVGDFPTVLAALGARWDETEVISLATCWKTSSGVPHRGRVSLFAGQRVVPVRPQPGLCPAADPQFDQRAAAPAPVGRAGPVPRASRLGRAGQPRHRRPLHLAERGT